ncbi:MAG: TetR/AcrR family transcriptional regulator [Cyclobacteriaceae bacterium]
MSDTKDKIISAAIDLFNEQGFVNVRLQNIADVLKISVGNLAYHYKNKEAIVATAYDLIGEELSDILSSYRSSPDLSDLDQQLNSYYHFINKYPFYFIDVLEIKRNHPHLHEERKEFIFKMKVQFEKRIEYNQTRGVFCEQMGVNEASQIADNICATITFWHTGQVIKDEPETLKGFKKAIWVQLFPNLTKKGVQEYNLHVLSKNDSKY